jgi:hypothetical protein
MTMVGVSLLAVTPRNDGGVDVEMTVEKNVIATLRSQ